MTLKRKSGIKFPNCQHDVVEPVSQYIYDKITFSFIFLQRNAKFCFTGLCVLGGRVYAVGGFNGSLRVRTVDIYDAAADQWSPCPEMEARRSTLGVAVLGNCVYAVRC